MQYKYHRKNFTIFSIYLLIIFSHLVKLLKIIKERSMWQNLFAIINSMDKDKNLKNENKDSNMDAQALQEQGNKANPSNVNTKPQSADEHTNTESANGSNNATSNSNTFQLDLAVLNEVSKIAKMGMDSISYLAPKVSDKEMRKVLVAMYSQYGNTQSQINQHFETAQRRSLPNQRHKYNRGYFCQISTVYEISFNTDSYCFVKPIQRVGTIAQ